MKTTLAHILVWCLAVPIGNSLLANSAQVDQQDASVELQRLHTEIRATEKTAHKDVLLNSLRQLRDLQSRSGALDSSLHTGLRIVHLSGATDDREAMASDWTALARIDQRSGNLPEAVAASKRALLILKTTNKSQLVGPATFDLLELLLEADRYSEFKHQSDQALLVFKNEKDRAGQAKVLCLQGECLTKQDRAVDALSILHLALRDSIAIKDKKNVAKILFALAVANAQIGEWTSAKKAFDEALLLDPEAPGASPELYGLLGQIDEALGDLPSALRSERQMANTKDSLLSATMTDRMVRIKTMYAVQAMDKELTELRQKNRAAMAELDTEHDKNHLAILFCAGSSVGLLVLLMLRGRVVNTARRARLRSTLVAAKVKGLQTKSLELERQNLLLTRTMMNDVAKNSRSGNGSCGREVDLIGLLVQLQRNHVVDEHVSITLDRLHGRIKAMALVNEHLNLDVAQGQIHLKAHFKALADTLLRQRELQEKLHVDIEVAYEDPELNDLPQLSLLLNELLSISIDHAADRAEQGRVSVILRRLGAHQCELLYTDEAGAISAAGLGNGSLSAELVQLLSKSLNGSIMLLKSEVTTFQLTFEPGATMILRKAS